MSILTEYGIPVVVFTVALTIHEFSHALAAYLLGDPTAKEEGRLTLNPLAHVDLFGLIALIVIKFGWAKPVPMNEQNFTYPRLYTIAAAVAGPLSNFMLAMFSLVLARFTPFLLTKPLYLEFITEMVWVNVMLGIFNLVPIPPLDGSHFIRVNLPHKALPYYYFFERFSYIFLIILLMVPQIRSTFIAAITLTVKLMQTCIL